MDFKYPYTDFHELNLDWFLAEFKKLTESWLQVQQDWADEQQAYQDLHDYVENYFANLDLYQEVHDILWSPEMQGNIQIILGNLTTNMLPGVVADQITAVVASQLSTVVALQLPTVVETKLPAALPAAVAGEAAAWLADNVDPDTGYVIDKTLTISQAAADAKVAGDLIRALEGQVFDVTEVEAPTPTNRIENNYTLYYGARAKRAFRLKSIKTPYIGSYTEGAISIAIFRYNGSIWTRDTAEDRIGLALNTVVDMGNILINKDDVVAFTNTWPLTDDVKANCYSTDTPSDEYLSIFTGKLQVYNSSAQTFSEYSAGYYCADVVISDDVIPPIQDDVEDLEKDVSDLSTIKGEYQALTVTTVTDKYIYATAAASSSNGTIQNDTGAGYADVTVSEGELYKISTTANMYKPPVVFLTGASHVNANYAGGVVFPASATTYADLVVKIPAGVVKMCINTTNAVSYPITVKKFTPTETVKYLAELDLNSFAKNPLQFLGDEISMFDKILCIGDSLTAGGMDAPPITPDDTHATRDTSGDLYSYPVNLSKNHGIKFTKKATGGITSSGWLTNYGSDDLTGHDACIIFLGSNDFMFVRDDGMTVADAIQTNYNNLLTIISLVQSQNFGIPIFLCTLFPGWSDVYGVASGVVTNVRTICQNMDGVYLIDFREYSKLTSDSPYRYGHPTALGYAQMAREIAGAVCYHVNNTPDDFRWIQFVGTRWAVDID